MATDLDAIANLTGTGITEAQAKTWFTAMRAALAEMGDPLGMPGKLQNLSLSLTVGSSALTIALKDRDGSDPSAASPVSAGMRNVTAATGDFAALNVSAASSLVVSSGSTLGTRSSVPFRLWIVLFNDGGTLRLGVINCVTSAAGAGAGSDVSAIYPLAAWGIASSTAEGGAGAADSAQTFYTGSAVSSKAFIVLGYATWESGLGTAGTWSAGPTRVQLFGPGVPLPGQLVQVQRNDTGGAATGTTQVPADDSIPQNTEGDQYMTQAVTPSSAANVLELEAVGQYACSSTGQFVQAVFQDSTANALASTLFQINNTSSSYPLATRKRILSGTTSATTFKARGGLGAAATTTFNGLSGSRLHGGVLNSWMEVREVMG
jgi:hypothetical protein